MEEFWWLMARIHRKKTIVFFHGWQAHFEKRLSRGFVWIFKLLFGKCDAFIVLSSKFRNTLKRWGVKKPVYIEVTLINEDDLEGFSVTETVKKSPEDVSQSGIQTDEAPYLGGIIMEQGEMIHYIDLDYLPDCIRFLPGSRHERGNDAQKN